MLQYGDFLQLKDGRTVMIRRKSDKFSVTLAKAKDLLKRGEVVAKSVLIDGDEVFEPIN